MMRGKGVSKDKFLASGIDQGSSMMNCGRQCSCGTKARLAHKHEINQQIAEKYGNDENYTEKVLSTSSTDSIESNSEDARMVTENVDDLVEFIEGSLSCNMKKKFKKERQKQDRVNALNSQHDKEKRLLEDIEKEKQRIEKETKTRKGKQQIEQLSKKQIKKASQKAKKLAEQEKITPKSMMEEPSTATHSNLLASLPLSQLSSTSVSDFGTQMGSNPLSCLENLKARLEKLTDNSADRRHEQVSTSLSSELNASLSQFNNYAYNSNTSSNLNPTLSLEMLKAKHQRELEMLQLKHKQALEEEELKAMHRQKEQIFMKQSNQASQVSLPQPQKDQLKKSGVNVPKSKTHQKVTTIEKNRNNNTISKMQCNRSQGDSLFKIPPKAAEALANAEKNAGNQIRISRNAHGGVDFTPIPGNVVNAQRETTSHPQSSTSQHGRLDSTEKLSTMFNQNMKIKPKRHEDIESSNGQSMVTIRRTGNPCSSEPTVTISQPQISKDNKTVQEKLLYTLVNGEVLKADDTLNLIPGAKPMPPSMLGL